MGLECELYPTAMTTRVKDEGTGEKTAPTRTMTTNAEYARYAAKMRRLIAKGSDLEAEARFVDMLVGRRSRVLDIGCGHGSAVGGLRARGHFAFGIDPTRVVLDVALDTFDPTWFRELAVESLSARALADLGIPRSYDAIMMTGNVPAFLSPESLVRAFDSIAALLGPGGFFIVGTSSKPRGGPLDQDLAAGTAGLQLTKRVSDWHLGYFSREDSAWSVSVYTAPGKSLRPDSAEGIFILR